jgi:peptide/nickel transport system substrate-binding protein
VVTNAITTTSTGNWWDSLGTPQDGGTLTIRDSADPVIFDPYAGEALPTIESAWMERLFGANWTVDPAVFAYQIDFIPNDYVGGMLATSWAFTDPSTLVVNLRPNVYWQNIAPANGRQFVAADVVDHYDRVYGLGGMTISPNYTSGETNGLASVTATDKYTVVFKYTTSSPEVILETLQAVAGPGGDIENPEGVQLWGNLNDWHHAIGTGPFILTDFVDQSSATLVKNPNYWGHDEHYPQNQLPYINKLNVLIINSTPTAEAAFRTGKIDAMNTIPTTDGQNIANSNSEITQLLIPLGNTNTIDMRNDVKPFNDIRVRQALQMAIDLTTIAKTYYSGTCSPDPSSIVSNYMTGWGFPYDQWPASLQAQYAYNPTQAKALLATAGYPNGFTTDCVASTAADLTLLQIVQSEFASIGVTMSIRAMDPVSWQAYCWGSRSEDQMGMRGSGALGHSYQPSRQLIGFEYSFVADYENVNDPVYQAMVNKALAETSVDAFKQDVSAVCQYVTQQQYVLSLLQPDVSDVYWPWLKGYSGQAEAISEAGAGAQLLGFFCSRFWIDQNLK